MTSNIRSLPVDHFGGAITIHFPIYSLYSPMSEDTATPQWVRLVFELDEFAGNHAYYELASDPITDEEEHLQTDGFRQVWHLPALTLRAANALLATIASELAAIERTWTSEDFDNVTLGPVGQQAVANITDAINRHARDGSLTVEYLADRAEAGEMDAAVDYALGYGFTTPEGIEQAIRDWFSIPQQVVLADTFAQVGPVLRTKLEQQMGEYATA